MSGMPTRPTSATTATAGCAITFRRITFEVDTGLRGALGRPQRPRRRPEVSAVVAATSTGTSSELRRACNARSGLSVRVARTVSVPISFSWHRDHGVVVTDANARR